MKASLQKKTDSGFTLIELLISLLILSVGLLSLATLQVDSMRQTTTAYMRTQAGIAATEMAERMRVNVTGVETNQYANIASPPGAVPTDCETGNCSDAQMAAFDAYTWLFSLQSSRDLLSAQGTVSCIDNDASDADACSPGSVHVITVMWDGRRNGATGTGCNFALVTDLVCYRTRVRP